VLERRRAADQPVNRPVRTRLRGELVLVDQPAEQVAAAEAIEVDHLRQWLVRAERRPLAECSVRPMFVEVPDVGDEHVLEVTAAEDQQSVEALASNASDPTFGVRSRVGFRNCVSAPAPASSVGQHFDSVDRVLPVNQASACLELPGAPGA
jgi:hypothetical protein